MSMKPHYSALIASVVALMSGASSIAMAQNAINLANSDSAFIDGRTLTIVHGKAKGDSTAEIRRLGAKELGPATLIIRSGDKLYIASDVPSGAIVYATDPGRVTTGYAPAAVPSYAVDPRRAAPAYDPSAVSSYAVDPRRVTTGYAPAAVSSYAVDPRRAAPGYDPSAVSSYAVDSARDVAHYAADPAGARVVINDPDYVYYRLKKAFEENWAPVASKP
jgi:hypothetical protein